MIAVRPFDPADAGRWDAYVLSHPDSHFGQCAAWRALTTSQYGVEPRYWVAVAGERVHGVLPLFESARALFSAPGGLLADDEAVAAALLEPARRRLVDAALDWIELRDQRRAWPHLETSGEHVTLELALERDPDRQWATFDAKLRNQIRKGERAGFEPRWGRDQVAAFHRVLLENMRDLGTPIRSEGYYRAALGALGDAADLLVLWQGRTPVGAMFVVEHRDAMVDPWASSLRRVLARCPNHVLYWTAIRRAIEKGLARFDFGRSQPGSGTFDFKRQWGAVPVPLHYQYALGRGRVVPTLAGQKERYAMAVGIWKRLPLGIAGRLGEPLKRRFPEVL